MWCRTGALAGRRATAPESSRCVASFCRSFCFGANVHSSCTHPPPIFLLSRPPSGPVRTRSPVPKPRGASSAAPPSPCPNYSSGALPLPFLFLISLLFLLLLTCAFSVWLRPLHYITASEHPQRRPPSSSPAVPSAPASSTDTSNTTFSSSF